MGARLSPWKDKRQDKQPVHEGHRIPYNPSQIENGFRILQSDENVKAILINIFGGILRCDRLANGVVQAAEKIGMRVPVIIRMEGTNLAEGRKILAESGLDLINFKDLKDAAEKLKEAIQ